MAEEVKKTVSTPVVEDDEHYEVVSEYRIGEGAPPPFLVICFILANLCICSGVLDSLLWLLEEDVT